MDISQILKDTTGVSLKAGKLKNGQDAIHSVAFSQFDWTRHAAEKFLKEKIGDTDVIPTLENGLFTFEINKEGDFDGQITSHASKRKDDDKDKPSLYDLKGVEIFRTGTWNGQKYTERDLADMVDAFGKAGYKVPIKLGHREASGQQAFGWVKSLRKVGDKLVADFMDLPEKVYKTIKSRGYEQVSSEIFENLRRGDKLFRKALKAVALLGAEIPAVAGLKPLSESFALPDGTTVEAEHTYTLSSEEIDMDLKEALAKLEEANKQIDKLKAQGGSEAEVKKMQEDLKAAQNQITELRENERRARVQAIVDKCNVPVYREFLKPIVDVAAGGSTEQKFSLGDKKDATLLDAAEALITRINRDTEMLFKYATRDKDFDLPTGDEKDNPAEEVERRIAEHCEKHKLDATKASDYSKAMIAVLQADRDLARRYDEQGKS